MEKAIIAVRAALRPLESVFLAYKNDALNYVHFNPKIDMEKTTVYSGRGGATLLTLENAESAYGSPSNEGDVTEYELKALRALASVWERYMTNDLDDEARRYWGKDCETNPENRTYSEAKPEDVVLISTRSGSEIVTLADAYAAYKANLGFIIASNKDVLAPAE